MPTKIDGNNGVLQSYDYQVLTTGFSYTFATGTTTLIAQPAGTLATGTITMPAFPADGMVVTFMTTQQVTAVTVQGNTGQSLVGGASQLIANQPLSYIYRLSNTTWYPMAGGAGRASAMVQGTAVASTSGTSIDFTGIPSWAERITVMFSGVSTNGTAFVMVQLGTGGTPTTSGYGGGAWQTSVYTNVTNGMALSGNNVATDVRNGAITITNITGNTWVSTGTNFNNNATGGGGAGSIALGGTLNLVRVTTVNGTDTFDAGTINIMYE